MCESVSVGGCGERGGWVREERLEGREASFSNKIEQKKNPKREENAHVVAANDLEAGQGHLLDAGLWKGVVLVFGRRGRKR
jgi:hypothetical protein